MSEKPCRRCLLRDASPETYQKYVASVLAGIPARQRADQALVDGRLSCCQACKHLDNGTCMACGCLVELRSAYRTQKCPYGLWDQLGGQR